MAKATNNSKKIDMLHVFVTDKCNMRCTYCYVDSKNRFNDELTTEELKRLLNELNSIEFSDGIHIEGGEPFLRSDVVECLTKLKDLSKVTIATNGTVPYDKKFDALKRVQRLGFSVEGATQETHSKLRQGNLRKLLDNMVMFKNNGFSVQSRTTLTTLNWRDVTGIVKNDYLRGIPIARFMAFTPVGRGAANRHLELRLEHVEQAVHLYLKAVKNYGDKVMVRFSLPTLMAEKLDLTFDGIEIKKSVCYTDCNQAAISANGDVFQCYNLLNFEENKKGNIRKIPFAKIIGLPSFAEKFGCPNNLCAAHAQGYTHLTNTTR